MITTSGIRIRVTTAGMIGTIVMIAAHRMVETDLPVVGRAGIRAGGPAMADLTEDLMADLTEDLAVDPAHRMAKSNR